jgi:hypothetical protein
MKKIIKYTVITSQISGRVATVVNEEIEKGWQPYGHMFVSPNQFHQVMVRYEIEEKLVPSTLTQ